jgi:hypothetical protein
MTHKQIVEDALRMLYANCCDTSITHESEYKYTKAISSLEHLIGKEQLIERLEGMRQTVAPVPVYEREGFSCSYQEVGTKPDPYASGFNKAIDTIIKELRDDNAG